MNMLELSRLYGRKYWLYPGKSMPAKLFFQCCELLNMSAEELLYLLKESKALVFVMEFDGFPHEDEWEHAFPGYFKIFPPDNQLSSLFSRWRYYEVRITKVAECHLADRKCSPRPFMP